MALRIARSVVALAAIAVALVGCAGDENSPAVPSRAADEVVYNPEPRTGPFVVVAVDNHFHDIHPVDRTRLALQRPFVVENEGRNLHNFTVIGTDISVDIAPGRELRWSRIGKHLSPGLYRVVCKYHAYVNMTGVFVVTR